MKTPLLLSLRTLLVAASVVLSSCGGGGAAPATDGASAPGATTMAGASGGAATVSGSAAGPGSGTPTYTGPGTTAGVAGGGAGGTGSGTDAPASGSGAGAGGGTSAGSAAGHGSGSGAGPGAAGGSGSTASTGNASGSGSGAGVGSGDNGPGTGASVGGSGGSGGVGGGTGGESSAGSGGAGSGGTGVGNGDSTGVAGGVGSGGTGVSGDGSGVGSGGTGASASAVGIGSVDGFGSIIVNDTHWEIDRANVIIADGTELKLGMSVRVAGSVSADLSRGTATSVVSAAELRGPVSGAAAASNSFEVLGIQVSTDANTVFDGFGAQNRVNDGAVVQVYGLPGASGQLHATRIERRSGGPAMPIVTGAVSQLNTTTRTFRLGALAISYANAGFGAGLPQAALANGQLVRVRAEQAPVNGLLAAGSVQSWYEVAATANGTRLSLSGLVTDFNGQSDFRVQGVRVNGSQSNVSGGPAAALGNGARVEVSGTMNNGVLVLDKLRLRGTGGKAAPVVFSVRGNITQFESVASFRVQGQWIDATAPGLVVRNGTVGQLAKGRKVTVTGSRTIGAVLIAETLSFD